MACKPDDGHLTHDGAACGAAGLGRLAVCCVVLLAMVQGGPALAAGHDGAPPPAAAPSAGQALQAEVRRLIGRAACRTDAQCRTLPLGVRACGGPQAYLAWSVLGTDEAALRRAAERYGHWQAQEQARRGTMSICMIELDPGAVCAKDPAADVQAPGRCVLGKDGEAAVGR